MARVAGYSLEQVDAFLGRLGNPIGIASYKPFHSTGEDFLHNYLGMIGVPVELCPYVPTNAGVILLTESAKFDPNLVAQIKRALTAGKSVVITSGLLRALQGQGIEDIADLRFTGNRILAHEYSGGFGSGNMNDIGGEPAPDILFPEVCFLTNDSWALVRAMADGKGYPLLLMNRYSRGVLYVWTMPDNPNDLYRLPPRVLSAIKNPLMAGFPARVDGPSQVALFAYDNGALIVESYLPTETDVTVSVPAGAARLRDLATGEVITGQEQAFGSRRGRDGGDRRMAFKVHLPPHSYRAFAPEQ
jgi:hypothetical protein